MDARSTGSHPTSIATVDPLSNLSRVLKKTNKYISKKNVVYYAARNNAEAINAFRVACYEAYYYLWRLNLNLITNTELVQAQKKLDKKPEINKERINTLKQLKAYGERELDKYKKIFDLFESEALSQLFESYKTILSDYFSSKKTDEESAQLGKKIQTRLSLAFLEMTSLFESEETDLDYLNRISRYTLIMDMLFSFEKEARLIILKYIQSTPGIDAAELDVCEKLYNDESGVEHYDVITRSPLKNTLFAMMRAGNISTDFLNEFKGQFLELATDYQRLDSGNSIEHKALRKYIKKQSAVTNALYVSYFSVNSIFAAFEQYISGVIFQRAIELGEDETALPYKEKLLSLHKDRMAKRAKILQLARVEEDEASKTAQVAQDASPRIERDRTDTLAALEKKVSDAIRELSQPGTRRSQEDFGAKTGGTFAESSSQDHGSTKKNFHKIQSISSKSHEENSEDIDDSPANMRDAQGDHGREAEASTNTSASSAHSRSDSSSYPLTPSKPNTPDNRAAEQQRALLAGQAPVLSRGRGLKRKVLIGLGIGLGVTATLALGVTIAVLIPASAPFVAGAFAFLAKTLGGAAGAWSLLSFAMTCPPLTGLYGGYRRWRNQCKDELRQRQISTPPLVAPRPGFAFNQANIQEAIKGAHAEKVVKDREPSAAASLHASASPTLSNIRFPGKPAGLPATFDNINDKTKNTTSTDRSRERAGSVPQEEKAQTSFYASSAASFHYPLPDHIAKTITTKPHASLLRRILVCGAS